jgi:hypothetical protein
MSKMAAAGGIFAKCNGRDLPGVRVLFKPKPGFSGVTMAEFSSLNGGTSEFQIRMKIEVQP